MQQTFKAILLDNDPAANEELSELLAIHCSDVKIVGCYEKANDALLAIVEYKPDFLFLDIEMPGKNGFEFFDLLADVNVPLQCIIVSGHLPLHFDQALDRELSLYIQKPIYPTDLIEMVQLAKERGKEHAGFKKNRHTDIKPPKILLTTVRGSIYIYPRQVVYAKADGKCTDIRLDDGRELKIMKGITALYNMLNDLVFFKPDKSWFINLDNLYEIHEQAEKLIMKDAKGNNIAISITFDGFTRVKQLIKNRQ